MAFTLGLWLAKALPERLENTLDRLVNRGVVVMTPEQLNSFKQDLERRIVKHWAPIGGSVIALALLSAFVLVFGLSLLPNKLPLLVAEMLGGYIAGCYLGRMACYGMLGSLITKANIILQVLPGHLDTVAGLKPARKVSTDEHGGPLTSAYLSCAVKDVQVTWECFCVLSGRFDAHNLALTHLSRILSEASIGKAYLKQMNIRPWQELQPDAPKN